MIAYRFLPLRDCEPFGVLEQDGVNSTIAGFLTPEQAKEIAKRNQQREKANER